MNAWLIRGGRQNRAYEFGVSNNIVGVGWPEAGPVAGRARAAYTSALLAADPHADNSSAESVLAVVNALAPEDVVAWLTVRASPPMLRIGVVTGAYDFADEPGGSFPQAGKAPHPNGINHYRRVEWRSGDLDRRDLAPDLQKLMNSRGWTLKKLGGAAACERLLALA